MFIIALGYLSEVTDHVPAVANEGKPEAISKILQGLSVIDEEGLLVKRFPPSHPSYCHLSQHYLL